MRPADRARCGRERPRSAAVRGLAVLGGGAAPAGVTTRVSVGTPRPAGRRTKARRSASQSRRTQIAPDSSPCRCSTASRSALKGLPTQGSTPGQHLQHAVGVGEPAARGEAIGLGPHEHEVEQRVLAGDGHRERRGHRHRLLEHLRRRRAAAKVSSTSACRTKNSSWYSFTMGLPTRAQLRQWMRRSGSPGR